MKGLVFALLLTFVVGLFAFSWSNTYAYALNDLDGQARLTEHTTFRTVAYDRDTGWRHDRDFDRPYVEEYGYGYDSPYYDYYDYGPPYAYYYGPGFSIDTPFFGINIP